MARRMAFGQRLNAISRRSQEENLLTQLASVRQLAADFGDDPSFAGTTASLLSSKLSAVGRYAEAHRVFDMARSVEPPAQEKVEAQAASLAGFEARDAVAALARASRTARAVFINEAHHVPQHRALTHRLLPILRHQGFTHFAAETLNEVDEDLRERGYPSHRTGTYTEEPLYADLVRTALRLGFQVVAYEVPGRPAKREPVPRGSRNE